VQRAKDPNKRLYAVIRARKIEPFALAVFRDTIIDKPFLHVVESIKTMLFKSLVPMQSLEHLWELPSYGPLEFDIYLSPTNMTAGIGEGDEEEDLAPEELEVRREKRKDGAKLRRVKKSDAVRENYICVTHTAMYVELLCPCIYAKQATLRDI